MSTENNNTDLSNTTIVEAGTAATDPAILEAENTVAESSYQRLREVIGRKVTEAIQSGGVLVAEKPELVASMSDGEDIYRYGPIGFDAWQGHLPKSMQQHYNCNHCNAAWIEMTCLAVMEKDGTLSYPLAQAILECSDDPVIAQAFAAFPFLQKDVENTKNRRASVMPVPQLTGLLIKKPVGGFDHFYGADAEVINAYNHAHQAFNDLEYVKTLYAQLTSPDLHPLILQKMFTYVKNEKWSKTEDYTALSRSDELVALVNHIRDNAAKTGRGMIYLWSLLQKKENGWMRHINGSLLGIVLDAAVEMKDIDDVQMALTRVKELISRATQPGKYKVTTAPASDNHLDQTVKALTEAGLANMLERRLMPLEEVQSVLWVQSELNAAPAPADEKPISGLLAARQRLKEQRDPATATLSKLDEIMGKKVNNVDMSVRAFIESIGDYASLAVSSEVQAMHPVFITTSVHDGDYDVALHFNKTIGKHAHILQSPTPLTYQTMASLAECYQEGLPFAPEIPVLAVFSSNYRPGAETTYVLHAENIGFNFAAMMEKHGTCILGTALTSEWFGMQRAILDLSRSIPMNTDAGAGTAGGIFMKVGLILNAVRKDGTKERIQLTAVK